MLTTGKMTKAYLDTTMMSPESMEFEAGLRRRIVGQEEAVSQLVQTYEIYKAGMMAPGHPIANLLFLGPTGTGKTRIVEAAAEILFGNSRAYVRIDCAEFQHSHEIAKLIGSPPGYIGHKETQPMLSQQAIDAFQAKNAGFTFVLFDEIEKASESLWQLLLGILDKATLKLGDNRTVDFSRTVICMTSNLGAAELTELVSGTIGFAPAKRREISASVKQQMYRTALEAAKRHFSPEFMNRLDKVIVFKSLTPKDLGTILDVELAAVQNRIFALGCKPFVLTCSRRVKEFLLREGTDPIYGARHLKRAIERHVVAPLSQLIATRQTENAAVVQVDMRAGQVVFSKTDVSVFGNMFRPDAILQQAVAV